MPKVKDGKVSLNLKVDENFYNRWLYDDGDWRIRIWVDEACDMRITNISEFIRLMVEKGIKYDKANNVLLRTNSK